MTKPSSSIVETCMINAAANNGDGKDEFVGALECITEALRAENEEQVSSVAAGIDVFFLIFSASLVFLMQSGFAMLCAGSVRKKNVQNTMMKNLLDACGAGVAYFICGYAFCYGGTNGAILPEDTAQTGSSFIGFENFLLIGVESYSFWFYQFAFAATASTIVAGTLAERSQMVAYFCYSLMLSGFVFPVVARQFWTVQGFLNASKANRLFDSGAVDFAGSAVVHTTGGLTALIASSILGPRRDRFHDEQGNLLEQPKKIQGYSVSLQVLGTFLLWFGWYGFNPGSVIFISSRESGEIAALCTVTTTLGGAFGCVSALFVDAIRTKRRTGEMQLDMTCALNGCLTGLVAVTGGTGVIAPWAACVVGIAAGILYLWSAGLLIRLHIDDAVEAINVHLFGGILGSIVPGLFAAPKYMEAVFGRSDHVGWFYMWGMGSGSGKLLAANLVGLLFIFAFVTGIMGPFFLVLNYLGLFRSDPLEEIVGLDVHYSGGADPTAEVLNVSHLNALRAQMSKRLGEEAEDSKTDDDQQDVEDHNA